MRRIALIGCGAVSQLYYAPALHELEKNKFVILDSILDPDPDNRLKLLEHFPDSEMILDLESLGKRNIDLAIIASPPDLHSQQTIKLLNMGIPVLCEKPLATNVSDGESMINASRNSGKKLAVGLVRRYFPATQTIRKILELNLIGETKSFTCQEGNVFRWPVSSSAYFQKSKGGVLMDIGVHVLDLLIWWFGNPETIHYEDDAMGGIEVNCKINLSFNNNVEGEVRLSRDLNLQNKYIFYGTKGWLSWEVNEADTIHLGFYDYKFNLSAQLFENNQISIPYNNSKPAYNFQQSFTSQIVDVLSAIEKNQQPLIPIYEALNSLKIIEYCYQNRHLIKMPWLSEPESRNAIALNRSYKI